MEDCYDCYFFLCFESCRIFLLTEIFLLLIFAIHTLARPYKEQLHNIIDGIMLFNMALITLLKWYTSVPSIDTARKKVIEFLVFLQLFLMYLPLVCFGMYAVCWFLKSCKIIPERLKNSSAQNKSETIVRKSYKYAPPKQKREYADEDLFNRASEFNKFSSSVTCSEVCADFDTGNTTLVQ